MHFLLNVLQSKRGASKFAFPSQRERAPHRRDFYDTIFLWQQAEPDYDFLIKRCGISTPKELKVALDKKMAETNLHDKQKDFQHLLFAGNAGNKIQFFKDFFESKLNTMLV